MAQVYSDPKRAGEATALPDVEVFEVTDQQASRSRRAQEAGADADMYGPDEPGWYWWSCFPGCLPDGEPTGPFETEAEAIADAQEGASDGE